MPLPPQPLQCLLGHKLPVTQIVWGLLLGVMLLGVRVKRENPSTGSTLPKVTEKQGVSRDQGDQHSLPVSSLGRWGSKPGQRARWSSFASWKSPVQLCSRGREIKAGWVAGREEIKYWFNEMHNNPPPSAFSEWERGCDVTVLHAHTTSLHHGSRLPCQMGLAQLCPEKENSSEGKPEKCTVRQFPKQRYHLCGEVL